LRFSALICASLFVSLVVVGCPFPGMRVPFCRTLPPPTTVLSERLERPLVFGFAAPDEDGFVVEPLSDGPAVPTVLVPGASGTFAELPAPLGSFPELFRPPALAGPLGTPLTPAVPAPAEPALGEPIALADPRVGPLAAPATDPPAEAPPEELLPPPPPPPCASAEIDPKDAARRQALHPPRRQRPHQGKRR
jgi:hypothetical protein